MKVREKGFSEYTNLEEARKLIISNMTEVSSEKVRFENCINKVLAEDIRSEVNVPPFDRAAMTGFAVKAKNTFGAEKSNPKMLDVVDKKNKSEYELEDGEAVRISTGDPMPKGTNAVVKVEETQTLDSKVRIFSPVSPSKNVSSKGEDIGSNEIILKCGRKLNPSDIGLLAGTKNIEIRVKKKPKIGIVASGGEIKEPYEDLEVGEITNMNSYTLSSFTRLLGCVPKNLGIISDDLAETRKILDKAESFDLLLFSGGASVDEKDLIPSAISSYGELIFHGVNIRPGSPVAFGMVDGTPVFSLPGFPAAAVLSFEILVVPAIRRMLGISCENFRKVEKAELVRKISSSLGRFDIVRVKLSEKNNDLTAEPVRVTGSSVLSSVSAADGFVLVSSDSEGYEKGSEVDVNLLFEYDYD